MWAGPNRVVGGACVGDVSGSRGRAWLFCDAGGAEAGDVGGACL